MELIQEMFVTVCIAILLSFLVAKLVSLVVSGDGGKLESGDVVGSEISTPSTAVVKELRFAEKLSVGGFESETVVDEIVVEKMKKVVERESDRESESLSAVIHDEKLVVVKRVGEVSVDGNSELQEKLLKECTREEESQLVESPENLLALITGEEVVVMERAGEMIKDDYSKLDEDLLTEITREKSEEVELPETLSSDYFGKEEAVVMETNRAEVTELHKKMFNVRENEEKSNVVELSGVFSAENSGEAASEEIKTTADCEMKKLTEGLMDEPSLELTPDDVVADQIDEIRVLRTEPGKEKDDLIDEDDDWEGIERTELEKKFAVAAAFVGGDYGGEKGGRLANVSSDVQTQLYGLHKLATEGRCYDPQPMALKISARALWNAWQRQGNMTQEEAMDQYIALLSEKVPGWMEDNPIGDPKQDIAIALEPDMKPGPEAVDATGEGSLPVLV